MAWVWVRVSDLIFKEWALDNLIIIFYGLVVTMHCLKLVQLIILNLNSESQNYCKQFVNASYCKDGPICLWIHRVPQYFELQSSLYGLFCISNFDNKHAIKSSNKIMSSYSKKWVFANVNDRWKSENLMSWTWASQDKMQSRPMSRFDHFFRFFVRWEFNHWRFSSASLQTNEKKRELKFVF